MAYKLSLNMRGLFFSVPTDVVDSGFKLCGGAQLKVLLLALRENVEEISPLDYSKKLGLSVGDVKDALDYWAGRGYFIKEDDSPSLSTAKAHFEIVKDNPPDIKVDKPTAIKVPTSEEPVRIKPTMRDVEKYKNDNPSIAFALEQSEAIMGKAFSSSDTATMVWLMQWAGMSADVLVTLVEYCRLCGKTSMRYVEKTAISWLEDGIDTIEEAEEKMHALAEEKGWEGTIKKILCISSRPLSTKEHAFVKSWKDEGFSEELIALAYQRTLDGAGKLSFPYLNRVLVNWKAKGIADVKAAENEKKDKEEQSPSFDITEIERRMLETTPAN